MKTVLIISSIFLLFACSDKKSITKSIHKKNEKERVCSGLELHQYDNIDCLVVYSQKEKYKLFLRDTIYKDPVRTHISFTTTTNHLDTITLDIWSPYMDKCYFQILTNIGDIPILHKVYIKTHFHDKIDIQDHYPNKELSKLNDMYQIYQDLWEEYEMNKSKK